MPLVKVLWSRQGVDEAKWECEDEVQRCFLRLFLVDDSDQRY